MDRNDWMSLLIAGGAITLETIAMLKDKPSPSNPTSVLGQVTGADFGSNAITGQSNSGMLLLLGIGLVAVMMLGRR